MKTIYDPDGTRLSEVKNLKDRAIVHLMRTAGMNDDGICFTSFNRKCMRAKILWYYETPLVYSMYILTAPSGPLWKERTHQLCGRYT